MCSSATGYVAATSLLTRELIKVDRATLPISVKKGEKTYFSHSGLSSLVCIQQAHLNFSLWVMGITDKRKKMLSAVKKCCKSESAWNARREAVDGEGNRCSTASGREHSFLISSGEYRSHWGQHIQDKKHCSHRSQRHVHKVFSLCVIKGFGSFVRSVSATSPVNDVIYSSFRLCLQWNVTASFQDNN